MTIILGNQKPIVLIPLILLMTFIKRILLPHKKLGAGAFAGLIFKSYENFTESKKNAISCLEVEI